MANESPTQQILLLMQHVSRHLRQHTDDAVHGLRELTMLQLQALFFVREQKKTTMSELAHELDMSGPSATSLVDRLVDAGWLARHDDPADRRITALTLTKQATAGLAKHLTRKITRVQSLIAPLTAAEQQTFIQLLTKIAHQATKEEPHA